MARRLNMAVERKWLTTAIFDADISFDGTSAVPNVLNDVQPGIGQAQRIGYKIMCSSMDIRFEFDRDNSSPAIVRMLCYYDKSETINGWDAIMSEPLGTQFTPLAYKLPQVRREYKVVFDRTFRLDSASVNNRFFHIFKKLRCGPTTFDATNGDILTGGYYIMIVSNISSAVNTKPNVRYICRLTFTDQ